MKKRSVDCLTTGAGSTAPCVWCLFTSGISSSVGINSTALVLCYTPVQPPVEVAAGSSSVYGIGDCVWIQTSATAAPHCPVQALRISQVCNSVIWLRPFSLSIQSSYSKGKNRCVCLLYISSTLISSGGCNLESKAEFLSYLHNWSQQSVSAWTRMQWDCIY